MLEEPVIDEEKFIESSNVIPTSEGGLIDIYFVDNVVKGYGSIEADYYLVLPANWTLPLILEKLNSTEPLPKMCEATPFSRERLTCEMESKQSVSHDFIYNETECEIAI